MKDLGKIIAKNRKANKMKQGELAKKLESYDIFVKQNSISAWESGMTQPSARQLLAICEILGIYDVYTEFIGQIPIHVIRERKVFYTTVSAGTGSFLDGEDYEMYSSPDIPEEAAFGVHISGDSMEPRYHNEELVWIEQTEQLDDGEIGIFYLDGNAYIKKFQNNRKGTYLISLNRKYDPIPITENSSFKIFGRVLS